jgi:uncharacterized protein (DUF2336 family)
MNLTPADVERLLRDDSADSRASIMEKVSANYNHAMFAGREREIAEQIFRLLMKDAALRVRETLAERIKNNPEIPRDIALHMANDVDSVALPMLRDSKVFSDADLVNIVEASRDVSKLMVISQRENVSERVSEALVGTSYPQVVSSLLANDTAQISSRSLEKIVDEFHGDGNVIEALVERKSLPMTLVERLLNEASDLVAEQLKERYNLSDQQIQKHADSSRDDVMLRMLQHDIDDREVMALVAQMAKENRLTPSLVMTSLCRGQLSFFTAALAHFSHIPFGNAKMLINDSGEHGFPGLYRKSGLPDSMYQAIHMILVTVKEMQSGDDAIPGSLLYANRLVESLLRRAGDHEVEYLPYFIALIRQNIHRH